MTKLISGRVLRLDSANVSADRYQYLRLEEAEPDLGLPSSLGQVFTSNLAGGRSWITLDTANVNETSNLYYTNARVEAFLQDTVFKTDVTLFSNLEVYGDLVVLGNTVSLNTATLIVEDKNIFLANGAVNAAAADGAGFTIDGANANLVYVSSSDRFVFNKLVEANIAGTVTQLINHTTSNLLEGDNLYYTNSRVVSAVTPILVTSNVIEGDNLYYTNSRVVSAVTPILTTANVSELDNQYFTNTRAILALDNANVYVGNIFAGDIISGNTLVIRGINVEDDALIGNVQVTGITGNTLRIEDIFAVDIETDSVTSNTWNRLYSSNVIEYNNLFYTNSRVVSAVTPLLVTSNVIEGDNLYYTNSRVVSAVTPLLTTANVNELDNLYYTNSRVVSAVIPLLVTSNVIEGDNLYYTNSRVLAHLAVSDVSLQDLIVQGNLLVQGNTITLNTETVIVEDKNILLANGAVNSAAANGAGITVDGADATITYNSSNDSWQFNKDIRAHLIGNVTGLVSTLSNFTTSNLAEGTNLYYTNARVKTYVQTLPIDLSGNTTSDLIEGDNLYYTNTRVVSAVDPLLTTANVDELTNQYFTNTRAVLAVNPRLTTANVTELDNLYYTNTRVVSAVTPLLVTSNVVEGDNLYYTNARVKTYVESLPITLNGNTTTDLAEGDNLYYTNARVKTYVESLPITLNGNTTTDLAEGDNLYYTNARVKSYVQTLPIDLSGNTTTDLAEGDNLYYTNARVDAYINDSITTTDIDEGSRQYFTNTRALLAVNPRLTTANVTELNNLYYTNSRVTAHIAASDIETLNLTVDGNLVVVGNLSYLQVQDLRIEDNMVYLNANSNIGNPDLGWAGNYNDGTYAHAGIFRDASDGIFKIYDGYTPEPDESAYINVAHESFRFANVQADTFIGKISTLSNHTTSNLTEGSRLYYTNTRVLSAVNPRLTTANVTELTNLYYTNSRVKTYVESLPITLNGNTTTDLAEGDNLYYTNARVDSRVSELSINVLADVDTTGIIDGQTIVWDGDTNTFIVTTLSQALAADFSTLANVANVVTTLNNFTTSNLAEGVNLYYTNARVLSAVNPRLTTANVSELNNQYFTNTRTLLAVNPRLTTANVTELDNLYYTNARVKTYVESLPITLNGNTTTDLTEGNNLYYTNSRVASYIRENFTTDDITEGNNLYYTNSRVLAHLASSNVAIQELLVKDDLSILGDLYVQGNTVQLNTATLVVEDKNIVIADGAVNAAAADGAGITVDGSSATILYRSSTDTWDLNKDLRVSQVIGDTTQSAIELDYNPKDSNTSIAVKSYESFYVLLDVNNNQSDSYFGVFNDVFGNSPVVDRANVIFAIDQNGDVDIKGDILTATTNNLTEGNNNLYYTNSRVVSAVTPLLVTSNVLEGTRLYYTNTRVLSAVNPRLTTANVSELNNQYFTNTRTLLAVNPRLTTANVTELNNLYYTNARVDSRVAELSINVLADVDLTGIQVDNILRWDGNVFVPGAATGTADFAALANVANVVTTLNNFTTTDLAEGDNLYYTNTRVLSAVNPRLTTANVSELTNLYYTNTRVLAHLAASDVSVQDLVVQGDLTVQGNTTTLNTATLIIEDKNIVLANGATSPFAANGAGITIEGANASITYNSTGDVIEVNKNVNFAGNIITAYGVGGSITGANLITTNVLVVYDRIEGIIVGSSDFAALANVANVVTTLDNFTTDYLVEGSTNFYYTNSRVLSAVNPRLTTANVSELNNLYYTNIRVDTWLQGANVNVVSLTSLGNVTGQNFISSGVGSPSITSSTNINLTANGTAGGAVIVTNSALRLRNYTTTDRGNLTPSSGDTIFNSTLNEFQFYNGTEWISVGSVSENANVANTVLSISNFDTADLVEGTNLYYTNARVKTFIESLPIDLSGNTTTDLTEGNNLYYTNVRVLSAVNPRLTTANVTELTNLYYTNARVVSAITPLLVTSNVIEGDNLYYTNARVDSRISETSVNVLSDVDITGIQNNEVLSWNGTKFVPAPAFSGEAETANTVATLNNFTTSNLIEGSNFYFTNTRARIAFTAGRGIAISNSGVISSDDDSSHFNILNTGHKNYRLTSTMSSALSFSSLGESDRAIVKSIHLTNISDDTVYFSGNVVLRDGNIVVFANCIPIPDGSSIELLKRPQIFEPNDIVNLQAFDNTLTPKANVIDSTFTYEPIVNDSTYVFSANIMSVAGTEYELANAGSSFAIIESIKLVNMDGDLRKANVYTKDANGIIESYLAYRTSLPINTSIEILQGPKLLPENYTLVSSPVSGNVSILVSYRNGDSVILGSQTETVQAGSNVEIILNTTISDGTGIYYQIV